MSGLTKTLLGVVAFFALVGLIVRVAFPSVGTPPPLAPVPSTDRSGGPIVISSPAPQSPPVPSGPVAISILTTDTKALWLKAVTEDFHKAGKTIASGRPIQVEIIQKGGPGEIDEVLLNSSVLKPVLVSPGDISFIEKANQVLKDSGKRQIPTNDCPPIVRIPAGFAMWRPMAEALGWPAKPIGWKTIIELAGDPQGWATYSQPAWGRFTFGHSHPKSSTFGFNVLASLAYAAAGKTEDLTPQDVRSPAVVDAFRKIEQETYHYGSSTSQLLNLMAEKGPGYLHAATTSETAYIYSVQHPTDNLKDYGWAFIFPAEGTFWSDNPTCIMSESWVSPEQREAAKIYRDFLLAPAAQEIAVDMGLRPVTPGVPLHCPICEQSGTDPNVTEKTVPPLAGVSGDTNAAIMDLFVETKKKATVVLLLDTSASMAGLPIKNAVAAAQGFLDRLHPDDEIEAYAFGDNVIHLEPSGRAGDAVEKGKLKETVGNLFADGSTALYDAICTGVEGIETLRKEDEAAGEARLYAVVLLSDGRETDSHHWKSKSEMMSCLPTGVEVKEVKVYTIAYGAQADTDLLGQIARHTNGKFYESNPDNIAAIYEKISAEQ